MNSPSTITIQNHTIAPGEQYEVNVDLARLHTRTAVEIPVLVYRSENPGPVLLLTAGLHGDEINGVEILRRMIRDDLLQPRRGSVIVIPVLNVFGFLHKTRHLPDGKDLNRRFPGSEKGSLASRIAFFLSQEILPQVDMGIDFHSGSVQRHNFPQVRCDFEAKATLELARSFAAPFLVNAKHRDASFRKEAFEQGKSLFIFEGGESLRFSEHTIEEGIKGTRRVMHHLDMVPCCEQAGDNRSVTIDRTTWIRASYSGLFQPSIQNGAALEEYQTLGVITDPFGKFEYPVRTSHRGYVLALNYDPVVNQGDALILFGRP